MATLFIMGIGGNIIDDEALHVAKWKLWYETHRNNSKSMSSEAWAELWRSYELAGIGDKAIHAKLSLPDWTQALTEDSHPKIPDWEQTQTFLNAYYMSQVSAEHIVPGFTAFADQCARQGDAVVLLSNAPKALVEAQVETLGLSPLQEARFLVMSQEDLPPGVRKPMPAAYKLASDAGMRTFGTPGNIVIVDNMPHNLRAAYDAGLIAALVNPTGPDESAMRVYADWHVFASDHRRPAPPQPPTA